MSMNDNVQLDSSRVQVRGRGAKTAGSIGGLGIIGVIIFFLVTGKAPDVSQLSGGTGTSTSDSASQSELAATCKTGADANKSTECWMVGVAESLDAFWVEELPASASVKYTPPGFVLFTDSTMSSCGAASAQTGPFYCPADKAVYLDVAFFNQMEKQFGATNSTLAQAYIVAHEFGHSIQDQTGILSRIDQRDTGPSGSLVRSELQADCLAGVWLANASSTVDPETGQTFLRKPTREQLQSAVDAAAAVGDDNIYEQAGMTANQESFTHGSSEKRMEWLMKGFNGGSFASCDTWSVTTP